MAAIRSRLARIPRSVVPGVLLAAALLSAVAAKPTGSASKNRDPLAAEIEAWSAYLRDNPSKDENWQQLKSAVEPMLIRARAALESGRRYLALQRFAPVRVNLAASKWAASRPAAEKNEAAGFEAAWKHMGSVLKADLEPARPSALEGVTPAAVRAVGEASIPQIRAYYEAALEYGRATSPETGLYYVGLAQAQKDFVDFCRKISTSGGGSVPPLRSLEPELDALETELLALYRPPASIDRHSDFIGASATLKEARELDAAGLRHGALLRLLLAAQRAAALKPPDPATPDAVRAALDDLERRVAAPGVDHSIARIFVEAARSDLDGTTEPAPGTARGAAAAAIVRDVLPRYFAALAPAGPRAPRAAPEVTVTLVRWPYT